MKYDIRDKKRQPDYRNLLKVLSGDAPSRPTLFEFFLNDPLYAFLLRKDRLQYKNANEYYLERAFAYEVAGYDYVTLPGSDLIFNTKDPKRISTKSLNDAASVTDRKSFDLFNWPVASAYDYSGMGYVSERLPEGMKIVAYGPGGVLENVVSLMGYDNLCYAIYDDPVLVGDVFDKVGSTLVEYYKLVAPEKGVVAVISNDDWGFNTQPMISAGHMRKYLIPWHREIVRVIHEAGKPAILHSCGNLEEVMDDIIEVGYDAKHSYEDNIMPVEDFYEKYSDRISILGGIDLDFLCRATADEVFERSRAMVEKAEKGYALGSGNSIPEYVPFENYMAMLMAVC